MPQSISRRRLLHLIGVTAGSSAAYQAAIGLGAMAEVKARKNATEPKPGRNGAVRKKQLATA